MVMALVLRANISSKNRLPRKVTLHFYDLLMV